MEVFFYFFYLNTLKKETEEDIREWKGLHAHSLQESIIVKMIMLSKDTYRFNAIPQNSNDISQDTREYDLKTDTEALRTLDRYNNPRKEE